MSDESFQTLTNQLEKELIRLHYTEASIRQYRRMWKRIADFLKQEGTDYFTEDAGMHFLEQEFNFFELEAAGKLTQSIINVFRVVRMLGDFQQHNSILRRYYKQRELLQNEKFRQLRLLQNSQDSRIFCPSGPAKRRMQAAISGMMQFAN